jgi:hypothetical protein
MAKRTPWNQLKPEYRARLESKGITAEQHAAGASLAKARGHEHTPENPRQYDPQKYARYNTDRSRLTAALKVKKEEAFGQSKRWNPARSDKLIREKPPSMAQLRWAVNDATNEDLLDAIREDPATYTFLGYG